LEYEQLTVVCAKVRAELAMARVNLIQVSNEFRRVFQLYNADETERIVSETQYDLAKAQYEATQTDVEEKVKIVTATENTLDRLKYMADAFTPGGENDPLKQALAMEEEKIKVFEQKMKPLQLLAPISGVVTLVHHQPGEQIAAGQPIITITSHQAERIIGYLPPSFPITPKLGMKVEVRTRPPKRLKSMGNVIGVGPHIESITNTLVQPLSVRPYLVQPLGRPIAVSLPPELQLLPGEPVDLTLLPKP
jgi:multidrug resistance efflux pump